MSKIIAHLVPLDKKGYSKGDICKRLNTSEIFTEETIGFLTISKKDCSSSIPYWQAQQLFITDDKLCEKGDWYLDDTNQIRQAITDDPDYWAVRNDYCHIIAAYPLIKNIPLPTDGFIAEWVKRQGQCLIEVEMESYSYEDYEENDVRYELRHKFTDGKLCLRCIPERGVKRNGVDRKQLEKDIDELLENTTDEEIREFADKHNPQPPSEEKDVEEAAAIALPYPDPKTYRVYDEHMRALHKQIDKERRLWIQGAQWQKQRSEKDVADFQKKIKDANGEFDNFINWLDEQERYKNVYIEYLNVNGNQ